MEQSIERSSSILPPHSASSSSGLISPGCYSTEPGASKAEVGWGGGGGVHLRHADPEVDDLVWVADLQHGPVRDGLPLVERQRFDVGDGGPPLSGDGAVVSTTQQSLPVQLRRS